ncbi:MAG: YceI family protein [Phycisphaerales bacterium]|nr:YceI family protein [Phycisphaerales bacterium]
MNGNVFHSPLCRLLVIPTIAAGFMLAARRGEQEAAPTQASATASVQNFEVDDVHSMSLFRVRHNRAGQFWGRFNDVSGSIGYAPDQSLSMRVTVQAGSVDTGNKKLDGHLKSPDFFNTTEFPTMSFASTSAKSLGSGMFEVTGDMTMHGVTKRVAVPVECSAISESRGTQRAGFEAVFVVKRSDFGMGYGVEQGAIGDETRIIVSLECIDAAAPKSGK